MHLLRDSPRRPQTDAERDGRDQRPHAADRPPLSDRRATSAHRFCRLLNEMPDSVFEAVPSIAGEPASRYARIDWETRDALRAPGGPEEVLSSTLTTSRPRATTATPGLWSKAYELGWSRFICYGYVGQRFLGCGFGPDSHDADDRRLRQHRRLPGIGAGRRDGDRPRQRAGPGRADHKEGKLVVHGDVGQTFMYGAKGGDVFVKGNAAGRPLINAVGRPKAVINGTCLDFLAESFMAGDPLTGGGFVILNGDQVRRRRQRRRPGNAVFRLEPVLAGFRRRDLRPRPAQAAGQRAAQRRRVSSS